MYCYGLIVRRKILRLYWADAIEDIRNVSLIVCAFY